MAFSRRTQGLLALLSLVMLGALALWLLIRPAYVPEPPTHAQWLEAATLVKEQWQPGDVVRLDPFWLTGGRIYFGDLDGGAREPFRILDMHRQLDIPYLLGYSRVWFVSAVEARQNDWATRVPGSELLQRVEQDALTIELVKMPEQALGFRLVDQLDRVSVSRQRGGEMGACKRIGRTGTFQCGAPGKLDVKVETRQIAGGPRRCLLVRPLADEAPTRLEFSLPAEKGHFTLRFGNTMEAGRQKDGGTVTVTATHLDLMLAEVPLIRKDYDLHEVTVDVDGTAESVVTVTLSTPDERKREVCLDGYFVRSPWCDGGACTLEP